MPDGTDRVDDMATWQVARFRPCRMAAADRTVQPHPGIRLFLDNRTPPFSDRPGNPASMLQQLISRVDNDVRTFQGDIAFHQLESASRVERGLCQQGVHPVILPP